MVKGKSLEEYTVAELKEIAREIGDIEGISAMKKADLIDAIRAAQGDAKNKGDEISPDPAKDTLQEKVPKKASRKPLEEKKTSVDTVSSLKEKITIMKDRKAELKEGGDNSAAKRLRRAIKRLKKRTRRMAKAVSP